MTKLDPRCNRDPRALVAAPPAANRNRPTPIRWSASLEDATTREKIAYAGALGELCSVLACFAEHKDDARDLKGASALLFDARNRMQRRAEAVAHG